MSSLKNNKKNPRKIVICVDDEKIVLNAVGKQLKRALGKNYEFELAESAEEAQEIILEVEEQGNHVVMIISDQIMPSMKGDEFLVSLHERRPQIIKILLTGQAALDSAINAVNNADLFRYITKPWEEEDFVLTVRKGLERYELLKKLKDQVQSFQRFVPQQFLESLSLKNYESVVPKQAKELTFSVLFADVRGFTRISERLGAEKTFEFLNEIFDVFARAISENNGFIDKYIGDAVMAIFNGPPVTAMNAALRMSKELVGINRVRVNDDIFPIRIGVGINVGSAILGVVGSDERLDTTVIGDVVNTSSRLEGLTKQLGVTHVISDAVYQDVKKKEDVTELRLVYQSKIRGKESRVKVYELFAAEPLASKAVKVKTRKDFETAVELFANGDHKKALPLFEKCLKLSGTQDPTLYFYIDMIKHGEDKGRSAEQARLNMITHYKELFKDVVVVKEKAAQKQATKPAKTNNKPIKKQAVAKNKKRAAVNRKK